MGFFGIFHVEPIMGPQKGVCLLITICSLLWYYDSIHIGFRDYTNLIFVISALFSNYMIFLIFYNPHFYQAMAVFSKITPTYCFYMYNLPTPEIEQFCCTIVYSPFLELVFDQILPFEGSPPFFVVPSPVADENW